MKSLLISRGNKPRRGIIKRCRTCGQEMYVRPCHINRQNYCSMTCSFKGKIKGKPLICVVCGNEYYRSPSQIKWRGSSCCSIPCRHLYLSNIMTGKKKVHPQLRGEQSPSWRGGKSAIYHTLRNRGIYKDWRESVFERDNYTCQACGIQSKVGVAVELHPHHIKSFTHYPKLRFDINNGVTVCKDCHSLYTSWQKLRGFK